MMNFDDPQHCLHSLILFSSQHQIYNVVHPLTVRGPVAFLSSNLHHHRQEQEMEVLN